MPSLSQNFKFLPSLSTSLEYPENETNNLVFFTDALKGKGYYNSGEGLHTIQFRLVNFQGIISVQGTLNTNINELLDIDQWGDVNLGTNLSTLDTTGLITPVNISYIEYFFPLGNGTFIYNLVGNYVFLRLKIHNFSQGRIDYIKYNF